MTQADLDTLRAQLAAARDDLNAAREQLLRLGASPYLTAKEAVAYLKLGSQNALYRLVKEHRMPFCRVGRLYRFDTRELDAWMRGFDSSVEQLRAAQKGRRR